MKFRIALKSPDSITNGLSVAIAQDMFKENSITEETFKSLDFSEQHELISEATTRVGDFASKWIRGGEYLTVEFDTEVGTCTVVPVK